MVSDRRAYDFRGHAYRHSSKRHRGELPPAAALPKLRTLGAGTRCAGFAKGHGCFEPGEALDARYVRQLVKRLADKAGIERRVHPHMLRHTALTALHDKTHDLRLVQHVAGHTTSRMTERYTHVHPIAVAEAMGAIDSQ
ncbi:MAG: tyrosine-type recombinase/integrase [Armatimonadia bacterium]